MKRMVCAAGAAAAALLTAEAAQAQATQGLELGLQAHGYDYREDFDVEEGPGSISDKGRLSGFTAEYGRPLGGWSLNVRFRYAQGEIDYVSSDGDRLEDVEQATGQLEVLIGKPFHPSPEHRVTPYVGLGSRVLLDRSGGRTTDTGLEGYDREVTYGYVPIGLSSRYRFANGLESTLQGQFNWIVGGQSESDLRSLGGPLLELEFEEGHGWEFAATVSRPLGRGRIGFGPFLRLWDLEDSQPFRVEEDGDMIEVVEPRNKTRELGVRLVYGF